MVTIISDKLAWNPFEWRILTNSFEPKNITNNKKQNSGIPPQSRQNKANSPINTPVKILNFLLLKISDATILS